MLQTAYSKFHIWQTRRMIRKTWGLKVGQREAEEYIKVHGQMACEWLLDSSEETTDHGLMEHGSQGLNEEDIKRCCYNPKCSTETNCISVTTVISFLLFSFLCVFSAVENLVNCQTGLFKQWCKMTKLQMDRKQKVLRTTDWAVRCKAGDCRCFVSARSGGMRGGPSELCEWIYGTKSHQKRGSEYSNTVKTFHTWVH